MPIYEYACQACGREFETLVLGREEPSCPSCQSRDLDRLLSLPSVRSSTTRDMAMRAARARDKKQATERTIAQREYEEAHND